MISLNLPKFNMIYLYNKKWEKFIENIFNFYFILVIWLNWIYYIYMFLKSTVKSPVTLYTC